MFPAQPGEQSAGFGQLRPTLNDAPPPGFFASMRFIGSLGKRFMVAEGAGSTLVVIDPHAARERIMLTAVMKRLRQRAPSQPTLFAATVDVSPAAAKMLVAQGPTLQLLGLEVEPFGGTSFALKSLPSELNRADLQKLLEELSAVLPDVEAAARILACHASRSSHEGEGQALLSELDRADFSLKARHPIIVVEELSYMELLRRAEQKN